MGKEYLRRVADGMVKECLEMAGAVLIEGPKWCGKTRTAEEFAKSALYITSESRIKSLKKAAESGARGFLNGDAPRLIDEWQEVPEIWDAVRFEVDHRGERGQFILTGSSVPQKDSTRHSGAGRVARVAMRPMSLFESGESNGAISLKGLFEGNVAGDGGSSSLSLEGLARAIARGGWPESLEDPADKDPKAASWYLDAVIGSDLSRVDGVNRKPGTSRRIIESIARNLSTGASMEAIRTDANGTDGKMTGVTLKSYIDAMEAVFLLENLPAWNPHLRSRTKLASSGKWHFADPSIALAALGGTKDALLGDMRAFGFFFESLCVRDLRVYAQPLGGRVGHLRNKNGFEVDLIVELPDGRWGAAEVKLGASEEDRAAENLLKLRDMIDDGRMRQPSFLMILTAGAYGYRRRDGVLVVPIGCLRD
ncbi:MAG: DUF4143 domain-containing protein [Candidatus Methanoplasma sp.]|jgi:predicted AAA+ superfamily ATPase|nr:DUF4143 domain-containing protein [Candidatus Methanoplasma sp.]